MRLPQKPISSVFVTAIYLVDADTLGTIYDRKQVVDLCGTVEDPCSEPNEGLIINEPRIGWLDGSAVVVIAAHSPDQSHAAGVIAYKIRAETNQPRLVKLWQVSDPATLEAKRWFRAPLSPRWQNSGQRSHCRLAYAECQAGIVPKRNLPPNRRPEP